MSIDDKLNSENKGPRPSGSTSRVKEGFPNIPSTSSPTAVGLAGAYTGELQPSYGIKWVEDQVDTIVAGRAGCELKGYNIGNVMPDSHLTTPEGFARSLYDADLETNVVILDLHYEASSRGEGAPFSGRDIYMAGQKAIQKGLVDASKIKFLIATSMEREFDWPEYAMGDGEVMGWKKVNHDFSENFAEAVDQVVKGTYENILN